MTTILVAEDEQRIASFLERGLRAAGFQTIVAPPTGRRRCSRRAAAGTT